MYKSNYLCFLRLNFICTKTRAVNEPNVQRTVREPFGGKFVYVRSFNKRTNMNKKFRSIGPKRLSNSVYNHNNSLIYMH
uniref:Uncharacterized protein n=1 Tax=Helianthus annuus TaxID=4232 RepID=A0A251RS06_HELAN